jgi:hypothetical protein
MKHQLTPLVLAILLCSCASTSMEKTWKSPNYPGGPVQKVAVLAVSDQGMVRTGLENRLARSIRQQGQAALTTIALLSLPKIKADKAAAAARLRQEGADSILIVRLVDRETYDREVRATPAAFVPVTTGFETYGWYGYYDVAFTEMGVTYSSVNDYLVLDSSLFDLNTGKRLWSVLTQTVVKEDADRLVVADDLAQKVAARLRKDGMIR